MLRQPRGALPQQHPHAGLCAGGCNTQVVATLQQHHQGCHCLQLLSHPGIALCGDVARTQRVALCCIIACISKFGKHVSGAGEDSLRSLDSM